MESAIIAIGIMVSALVVVVIVFAAQQEKQHGELMRLLSDLATMLGDGLDAMIDEEE